MRKFARSKPLVAIAASLMTVALIGGTAVAARKITSKDIKDGTIKERDLRPSLADRINRRGPRGPQGPRERPVPRVPRVPPALRD